MKKINCEKGKFQELRTQLLEVVGESVEVVSNTGSVVWNFDEKKYKGYTPKTVYITDYIKNMVEKDIHNIYQILVHGGILTRLNSKNIIADYEGDNIKIKNALTNKSNGYII